MRRQVNHKRTAAARLIWPGPECLRVKHISQRLDQVIANAQRTRGIGEGRAMARARMGRFVAWLRTVDDISHGVALRQAHDALSPEHAAQQAAAEGFHWPFVATGWGVELRRDAVRCEWATLASDLVRSPEWAALPFNARVQP